MTLPELYLCPVHRQQFQQDPGRRRGPSRRSCGPAALSAGRSGRSPCRARCDSRRPGCAPGAPSTAPPAHRTDTGAVAPHTRPTETQSTHTAQVAVSQSGTGLRTCSVLTHTVQSLLRPANAVLSSVSGVRFLLYNHFVTQRKKLLTQSKCVENNIGQYL